MIRRVTEGARSDSPAATTRTPSMRVSGGAFFSMNPAAPSRRAVKTYSSRSNVVRITTRDDGHRSASSAVASNPSITGIWMSTKITSGCSRSATLKASLPFAASPTTVMSGSLSRIIRIPESEPDITVVGEAANGKEALRVADLEQPDVILVDIQMPVMDGLEATALLAERCPSSRVVILTTFERDEYVFTALREGAAGFMLKNAPPETLIE